MSENKTKTTQKEQHQLDQGTLGTQEKKKKIKEWRYIDRIVNLPHRLTEQRKPDIYFLNTYALV